MAEKEEREGEEEGEDGKVGNDRATVETNLSSDLGEGERDSKERGVGSELVGLWSWKKVVSVFTGGEPMVLTGEGSSLMLEWSRPTEVALMRTLQHLKQHYGLFGGGTTPAVVTAARSDETGQWTIQEGQTIPVPSSPGSAQENGTVSVAGVDSVTEPGVEESATTIGRVLHSLSKMTLSFHFTDANVFIYGLTPSMWYIVQLPKTT